MTHMIPWYYGERRSHQLAVLRTGARYAAANAAETGVHRGEPDSSRAVHESGQGNPPPNPCRYSTRLGCVGQIPLCGSLEAQVTRF